MLAMTLPNTCSGPDDEFAVGTVRGLRTWDVQPDGTLESVTRPYLWADGENVAKCVYVEYHGTISQTTRSPWHGEHPAEPGCTCGFYAYYDGTLFRLGGLLGVIDGYGHVTVGTKGFRAEKAEIKALCLYRPPLISLKNFLLVTIFAINIYAISLSVFTEEVTFLSIAMSLLLTTMFGFAIYLMMFDLRKTRIKRGNLKPMYDMIREKYPSAEIFTDHKKMVRAYTPHNGGFAPHSKFRWGRLAYFRATSLS